MGSKLDLSYWLVKAIYNEKFKFATIDLPKWYKKFYHEIIKADPCVVDLRKMGPYYYDFGIMLVNLVEIDMSQTIAKTLLWVRYLFRSFPWLWRWKKKQYILIYIYMSLICFVFVFFFCFNLIHDDSFFFKWIKLKIFFFIANIKSVSAIDSDASWTTQVKRTIAICTKTYPSWTRQRPRFIKRVNRTHSALSSGRDASSANWSRRS